MKFRRIYIVGILLALGILLSIVIPFLAGLRHGATSADNRVKALMLKNDSINKRLAIAHWQNDRAKDTIQIQRKFIQGIELQLALQDKTIATIKSDFYKFRVEIRNYNLRMLDSLRWAWYPDSVTVAKRQNKELLFY